MPSDRKPGTYVLATRHRHGDPHEQWCCGFYSKSFHPPEGGRKRHIVCDRSGTPMNLEGFGRVRPVTKELGEYLRDHAQEIRGGTRTVWWWLIQGCQALGIPEESHGRA